MAIDLSAISKKERTFLSLIFISVITLLIGDVVEDIRAGTSFEHVFFEVIILSLCLIGVGFLWLKYFLSRMEVVSLNQVLDSTKQELFITRKDLVNYKKDSKILIDGLSKKIDQQFIDWGLTDSEKDIAFFLLKGLSSKEIAEIRRTSEKTVRQQSTSIYHKAQLSGRHELTAYFLEDLFLPTQNLKMEKTN